MSEEHQTPDSGEIHYYGPMIEFDTNDPEFIRGAEFGAIFEKLLLKRDEVVRIELVRRSNEEMVRRSAHATGREYSVEYIDDVWMTVIFELPTMPNIMDAMEQPLK